MIRSLCYEKFAVTLITLLTIAVPWFAKLEKDVYSGSCGTFGSAVKDTLRNSGKYGIMGMDSNEMTATYTMGIGAAGQKRINSVVLNVKGDSSCEMVVQSGFSGLGNDDAGDFKKRVEKSLAQFQPAQPAAPAKPDSTK